MVGLVLQASGVKYLTGQNGYLFFGNFMGNIGIQWGIAIVSSWNGVLDFTYPLAFSKSVLYAVTQEANPYSWRENQSATVTSAFYNQSLTSCQVVAKTITNGGNVLDTNSSTKVLIIGY